MNIPTLMTRLAALQGNPLPISSRAAPSDDHDSERIDADAAHQLPRSTGVHIVRNIEFARRTTGEGKSLRLRLDLMIPQEQGPHPLVVFVPGGGFVMAPKVAGVRTRRYVAASGFVVASIEYRTVRHGATYQDALDDLVDAVCFLRDHADQYAIDPRRVGLWGESAGGYLVAMAGVTADEARWGSERSPIRAVVDKFGASDLFRIAEGFDDETVAKRMAPGNPLATFAIGPAAAVLDDDPDAVHAADPARRARGDAAAFLIFHGTDDRIVSPVQTRILHDALLRAGARSHRVLVVGAGHGDIEVTGGEAKYWTTEPMTQMAIDFLHAELDTPEGAV